MTRAKIAFRGVGLVYDGGRPVEALRGVDFGVGDREFACVLGPSGCGKSTLLHLAAGFIKPTAGRVLVNGTEVSGPGIDRGVVFQQHNLFPWETVAGNVGFGPRLKGLDRRRRGELVSAALREVGLAGFAPHYPNELSVGMQQRVGLARAFANDPDILLMDEPFGALDALTRLQMQDLLLRVWERRRRAVLFVTHDVDEALRLGDRVLVLSERPGRVILDRPVSLPRPRRLPDLSRPEAAALREELLGRLMGASR